MTKNERLMHAQDIIGLTENNVWTLEDAIQKIRISFVEKADFVASDQWAENYNAILKLVKELKGE